MHAEAYAWVKSLKDQFPQFFHQVHVVEAGAYDINGSVRDLFTDSEFVGIDYNLGPGVDYSMWFDEWVAARRLWTQIGQFVDKVDVVFSTEMLEHDPRADKSVKAMIDLCRPGGLVFITCAGLGREVHCLETTGHYQNIGEREIELWFASRGLTPTVVEDRKAHDLYCYAIKA